LDELSRLEMEPPEVENDTTTPPTWPPWFLRWGGAHGHGPAGPAQSVATAATGAHHLGADGLGR
jgi:hypothetical protein